MFRTGVTADANVRLSLYEDIYESGYADVRHSGDRRPDLKILGLTLRLLKSRRPARAHP